MSIYIGLKEKISSLKYDRILDFFSGLLLLLLFLSAITRLDSAWDSLAYHLPFAARQAGIISPDELMISQFLEQLYQGVPILAETLQGYLWRITGWITATNLISWGSLVIFIVVAALRLDLSFWKLTLLSLSVPLILLQSITSYNDLINGCFIALGIVGLFAAVKNDSYNLRNYFFTLFPIMLSTNVKYQALPVGLFYTIIVIFVFLWKNWNRLILNKRPSNFLISFILITVFLGAVGGFTLFKNFYFHHNPVYPLPLKIGPIEFPSNYTDLEFDVSMSEKLKDLPRFQIYLISLSEIYLWTDNNGQLWGIGGMPGSLSENIFFKLGGFFVANLILWSIFLLTVFSYNPSKKKNFYFIVLITSFLFVGFLPSSGLLRYWLFLPLVFILVVLLFYEELDNSQSLLKTMFVFIQLMLFAFVTYQNIDVYKFRERFNQTVTHDVSYAYLQTTYHLEDMDSSVCIVHSRDNRLAFLYKITNMSFSIQDARSASDCIYENILILDQSQ